MPDRSTTVCCRRFWIAARQEQGTFCPFGSQSNCDHRSQIIDLVRLSICFTTQSLRRICQLACRRSHGFEEQGSRNRVRGTGHRHRYSFKCSHIYFFIACFIASPMPPGLAETMTPTARKASIFSAAPPPPPEIIAPAWPMRFPGGAV